MKKSRNVTSCKTAKIFKTRKDTMTVESISVILTLLIIFLLVFHLYF